MQIATSELTTFAYYIMIPNSVVCLLKLLCILAYISRQPLVNDDPTLRSIAVPAAEPTVVPMVVVPVEALPVTQSNPHAATHSRPTRRGIADITSLLDVKVNKAKTRRGTGAICQSSEV